MQSTSRVQSHSNNIIKDFLIAGLSQATLKQRIQGSMRDQISIEPEVLFSLYQSQDEME